MLAEGYKDTEVGVIPIEWDVVKLKDIVKKLQSGGTPLSTNSAFYGGNIPFVKIDDITRSGKYLTKTKVSITESGLDSSSAWLVPTNSILYSMYASIGFLSINKIEVSTNQAIMNIIPDYSKITLEFLYQYLLDLKGKIDKFIDQTTQKNLNAQKIKDFNIPLPALKEQKKIADILSTADEKIDAIVIQIEKTETLKKGLLQKLLSEGIGHSEFKDSELGKIPLSWEVVELRDIGKVSMCKRIMKSETTEYGEIPFYKIGTFGKEADAYISQELYTDYKNKYSFPSKGDILISASGTIGRTVIYDGKLAYFQDSNIVWIANQEDKALNSFLFYVYITVKWHTDGNTIARLYNENLRRIKIPLPPLEEQKQIAEILSTADEKLKVLRAKKEKYETLKKGLLQKLLSGEVRV